MYTRRPSATSTTPSFSAAVTPSTTAGYVLVAALNQVPSTSCACNVSSRPSSAANTEMPLVMPSLMVSVRRTVVSTVVRELTAVTGPMRLTMPTAVVGSSPEPRPKPAPACTSSRFVPSALIFELRSSCDDADSPSTPTMAAMPMATPSVDRPVRSRRVRRPSEPTRSTSPTRSLERERSAATTLMTHRPSRPRGRRRRTRSCRRAPAPGEGARPPALGRG